VTDWTEVAPTEHPGERGFARFCTRQFGDIRVRMVEYSPGYVSDHFCEKGHIILCLEGEVFTELEDGRSFSFKAGMSYQVADGDSPHRTSSQTGARLFTVD
jgi:quercetin dioxygenase-like cupin family protein